MSISCTLLKKESSPLLSPFSPLPIIAAITKIKELRFGMNPAHPLLLLASLLSSLTPAEKNWGDAASPIDSAVTSPSLSPVSQRSRASSSLSSSHDVPVKMEPIPMASIPIDVLVSPRKLKKGGHQRVPSLHVEDILRKDGLLSPRYERASQFLSRPTEHHSAQLRSLVGFSLTSLSLFSFLHFLPLSPPSSFLNLKDP